MKPETIQQALDIANGRQQPQTALEKDLAEGLVAFRAGFMSKQAEIEDLKAEMERLQRDAT